MSSLCLFFAVGYLMRTAVRALVGTTIDDTMNQVPGLRVVYNASKMAIETSQLVQIITSAGEN